MDDRHRTEDELSTASYSPMTSDPGETQQEASEATPESSEATPLSEPVVLVTQKVWIGFLITAFLSVDTCHDTCTDWITKRRVSKKALRQATRKAREKVEEAKVSYIDENDFYEVKDAKERKHFKYISNA